MLTLHQAPSDSAPEYLEGFISGEIINFCMAKKARIYTRAFLVWISYMLILHQAPSDSGPAYLEGFISGEIALLSARQKRLTFRFSTVTSALLD